MKMLRAIIRREKECDVVKRLEEEGFPAFTRIEVFGRGVQGGIQIGKAIYEELAKTMIMIVVKDKEVERAKKAIFEAARTGNFGDGKIFITHLEESYTIRTAKIG